MFTLGLCGSDDGAQSAYAASEQSANPPKIGSCQVFPKENAWNTDISNAPIHPNSNNYVARINSRGRTTLHPDFSSNLDYGIPYTVVDQNQPKVPVNFFSWPEESDPGPYPIPANAPIEGGSDRHVLVVQEGDCKLYEMFEANPLINGSWEAAVGAVWDLNSNKLRPEGWTSADAAGLPILPGLVRYEEIENGEINHALRFTVAKTQRKYVHPATHYASESTDPNDPPMGLRLRLKASYDISGFSVTNQVILKALKRYGMIVADNGADWFISGTSDPKFNDEDIYKLKNVPGSAFEVVGGDSSSPEKESKSLQPMSSPSTTPTVEATVRKKLVINSRKVRITRTGKGKVKISCPKITQSKCSGKLKLKATLNKKVADIARKSFTVKTGSQSRTAFRVSKRALKALKRKKRIQVTATAQSKNSAVASSSLKTKITLLKAKK